MHDIEDLCRVGRSAKACAYFASRKFAGVLALASLIHARLNTLHRCEKLQLCCMLQQSGPLGLSELWICSPVFFGDMLLILKQVQCIRMV